MKKVTLNSHSYELVAMNKSFDRLQLLIKKTNLEVILQDAEENETITITEDDEVSEVLKGFKELFALSVVGEDKSLVNLEFLNTDLQKQLTELSKKVEGISAVNDAVDSLNESIEEIHSGQQMQDEAIDLLSTQMLENTDSGDQEGDCE